MKKWKCSVCGYIHEGEEPPAACPLCKAPAEKFFNELKDEDASKRWRCSVCGYIHEGAEPPQECPICKAGSEKFFEIDAEGNELAGKEPPAAIPAQPAAAKKDKPGLLARMAQNLHLHPIAVHTPNGLLPVAAIFLALAVFLSLPGFELAAYYNLFFVLICMPVVLFTGFLEWQHRYNGAKTLTFLTKIACGMLVTLSLIILVGWRFIDPTVIEPDSAYRIIYLGIAAVTVLAAGIAGSLGGKLVFGSRDR